MYCTRIHTFKWTTIILSLMCILEQTVITRQKISAKDAQWAVSDSVSYKHLNCMKVLYYIYLYAKLSHFAANKWCHPYQRSTIVVLNMPLFASEQKDVTQWKKVQKLLLVAIILEHAIRFLKQLIIRESPTTTSPIRQKNKPIDKLSSLITFLGCSRNYSAV